jgi:hypothetical protein
VVKKMLHYVHEKMEQVTISIETLLNLVSLSAEEAAGHLRTKKTSTFHTMDVGGRLLLMKEWTTHMKAVAVAQERVMAVAAMVVEWFQTREKAGTTMLSMMSATNVARPTIGTRSVDPRTRLGR